MAVDHRYYIARHNGDGGDHLETRIQLLDGQQALDFVRFGRPTRTSTKRAPATLPRGAQGPLATSLSIFSIPGVIGALKNNVEIGRGGSGGAPSISEIRRTPGSPTTSAAGTSSA